MIYKAQESPVAVRAACDGGRAHREHGQQLLQGQACRLCERLRVTTHLNAEENGPVRGAGAKLRALAQHLDHSGRIGRGHVLTTAMLRQKGGCINMAPIPHESLSSTDGGRNICGLRGK